MRIFFNNEHIDIERLRDLDNSIVRTDGEIIYIESDDYGYLPVYYKKAGEDHYIFDNTGAVMSLSYECIDREALCDLLRYRFISDGKTPDTRMIRLSPYECITIRDDKVILDKKDKLNTSFDIKVNKDNIREDLIDYFKRIPEKDVHIMFSGGIDSTILVIAAYLAGKKVYTYSIDIEQEGFSEKEYRKDIVDRYVFRHKEYMLSKVEYLSTLEKLIKEKKIPFIYQDTPAFVWLLNKADITSEDVFFGLGGDEWFFGYDRMVFSYLERRLSSVFDLNRLFKYDLTGLFSIVASEIRERVGSPFLYISEVFDDKTLSELLRFSPSQVKRDGFSDKEDVSSIIEFEYQQEFPFNQAVRLNSISEATGRRILLPFLQKNLINTARCLDFKDMVREGRKKDILYRAFQDYLPKLSLKRQKSGFKVPLNEWYDSKSLYFIETLLENNEIPDNLFDLECLKEKFLKEYTPEQKWYIMMVLNLLCLK